MPRARGFDAGGLCWALALMVTVHTLSSVAWAAPGPERFSLLLDVGPVLYRYEESGEREFAGLETEWADVAFRIASEGRYLSPFGVSFGLRFSYLVSAGDLETNNQGNPPTDLRVVYQFNLQPSLQYELQPHPRVIVAPDVSWDFNWYLQGRETTAAGDVDERVFWYGPAPGLALRLLPRRPWAVELSYRHSFLIGVDVSNSFAESLGFGDFSTQGERDEVAVRVLREIGERWTASLGYRFESARIDASGTRMRSVPGPNGPQSVRVQFPSNDHTLHGLLLSAQLRF